MSTLRYSTNTEEHHFLSRVRPYMTDRLVWRMAWNSLVEGDEQLHWASSQTTLELCHACVA